MAMEPFEFFSDIGVAIGVFCVGFFVAEGSHAIQLHGLLNEKGYATLFLSLLVIIITYKGLEYKRKKVNSSFRSLFVNLLCVYILPFIGGIVFWVFFL